MRKPLLFLVVAMLCMMALSSCEKPDVPHEVLQAEDFPFDPQRKHDGDFIPSGSFTKISENLYCLDDCCNVYVVRNGSNATLIDFGSGAVLKYLTDIGVEKIDRILFTHHHRDQVQGLCDMSDYPFTVTVPAAEAHFFEKTENFWDNVKLYINYNCRSHWNTIRTGVRVDERVSGGDSIDSNGIEFSVLNTPGHTDGSISYCAVIDGRQVVFSGDLIAGKGKVVTWFDLHWDYYGFVQGMNASDTSFARILETKPDVLFPSHGKPIENPLEAISENQRIYATLRPMLIPNEENRPVQDMREILPHLVYLGGTGYAIVSDSGKAFIYDMGYINANRINEFKRKYNVTNIDAVSFSHYHDDHIIRTYELQRRNDTEVWIYENMLDIFEYPFNYKLPCLIPFPIIADRVLHDGDKIEWEGFTLEFMYLPGQTEFHQGLFTVIDGKKVLFTGDNTWKKIDPELSRNGPVVPHNEYFLDGGFIICAQKMLQYIPDIVCPAHTEEYSPSREDLEEFLDWAHRLRNVMTGLIDQPDPNFGMDYRWCRFYPYRTIAESGDAFWVDLMIRNHLFKPVTIELILKHSENILCDAPVRNITIEAKKQVAVPFFVRVNYNNGKNREIITADITMNGRYIGEYTEAMIDIGR